MNDREQVIATLTEHLNHWKRLLSEGICCEVEGKQTIDALEFAIESIKVDRAYDLAYEKVDFIEIPEKATNGDMVNAVFPNAKKYESGDYHNVLFAPSCHLECCNKDWWNSPYRKEN